MTDSVNKTILRWFGDFKKTESFSAIIGPKGLKGDTGDECTINIGALNSGEPGTDLIINNVGTPNRAIWDVTIPRGYTGLKGDKGNVGSKGDIGNSGTLSINSVTTGLPGSDVIISNIGSSTEAILDITIPRGFQGIQGIKGDKGESGTNQIGQVTSGTISSFTNVGTSKDAIWDVVLEKGDKGDKGNVGDKGDKGDKGDPGEIQLTNSINNLLNEKFDVAGGTINGDVQINGDINTINPLVGQFLGGFGATSTAGVRDFDDDSNARTGSGQTLLTGAANNAPAGGFWHTFNFGYSSTNNTTQFAIPYGNNTPTIHVRGRFGGNWGEWTKFWTDKNDGAGSGLDADFLQGISGSLYPKLNTTNTYSQSNFFNGTTRLNTTTFVGTSTFSERANFNDLAVFSGPVTQFNTQVNMSGGFSIFGSSPSIGFRDTTGGPLRTQYTSILSLNEFWIAQRDADNNFLGTLAFNGDKIDIIKPDNSRVKVLTEEDTNPVTFDSENGRVGVNIETPEHSFHVEKSESDKATAAFAMTGYAQSGTPTDTEGVGLYLTGNSGPTNRQFSILTTDTQTGLRVGVFGNNTIMDALSNGGTRRDLILGNNTNGIAIAQAHTAVPSQLTVSNHAGNANKVCHYIGGHANQVGDYLRISSWLFNSAADQGDVLNIRASDKRAEFGGPVKVPSFTVVNAPSASSVEAGSQIYVTDGDSGSPCIAVSDGITWRRVSLGQTIST